MPHVVSAFQMHAAYFSATVSLKLGICFQANDGWGRLGSQLYQNHYDTHEHSGWSDDDDTDPDGIQPHTGALLLWQVCVPTSCRQADVLGSSGNFA